MSVAEGTPPILLPADPGFREGRARDARFGRLGRAAIIAAALVHAAVIVAVVVQWPALFPVVPPERPPIAVTLVMAPPAPPPAPQAKPAAPPPPLAQELLSGPDTQTTAPPKAADKGPEAAPQPKPPPPVEAQSKTATAEAKPNPTPEEHSPKPKVATRETTPKESRGAVNRAPGETEREGDPYLNELFSLIERHRTYPANARGSLGLQLEGTSVYLIAVRSDGQLINAVLERSAGADILDQTALKMIQEAAPFPPPPASEFPPPGVVLEVTIHLFPGAG
jgi:periplasmic protein TonB